MVDQVLAVVVQLASGSWNTIFTPAHWQVISWPLVAVTARVRHSATMSMPLAVCWLMAPASLLVHLLNTYQQHKIGCHS